jgi:hypothetical protein
VELLLQLLGHGKLSGLCLDLQSGLLGRHGLAHIGLDGGRFRRNLLGAGELPPDNMHGVSWINQRLPFITGSDPLFRARAPLSLTVFFGGLI